MVGLASVSACGGGDGAGDAGARLDAPRASDAASDDAGASDAARSDDASAMDASGADDAGPASDAPTSDAGPSPDTGCTYLDEPYIVYCVDTYEYVRAWTSIDGPSCPPYATGTDGARYDTLPEAIAGSACEDACVWRAGTSVSLVRCGHRSGYIEFVADGCASVFETPDGIFQSIEAWDAAFPCP